ncbi:MAG TPA: hypothetical protein VKO63_01715, partial [Chitinispirillaceae bacterium]|nr:hypothetical protein [Chitinispirillaceae bacterium]
SKATAFPDDSIEIGIIVNIPRLVKSMQAVDGEDNNERVLALKDASSIIPDTVFFKTLYKTPGNKSVTIKAVLSDNTNYNYSFEIPVILPPMEIIFDTIPNDTTVFTSKATVFRIAAHTLPSTTINYALISLPAMADSCFFIDGTGCASISINPPNPGVYGLKIIASNTMVKDTARVTMYVTAAPVITVKSSNGETRIGVVDTLTFTGPENDSLSLDVSGNLQSDEVKVIATGLKNVIKVEFTPKESKTYSFALRVKGVITEKYQYNDIVFVNHPVTGNQTSIWKQDTITISTPENKMATQSIGSLLNIMKPSDAWLRCEKGTIIDGIWRDNIPWGARPVDTVVIIATYNNREYPLKMFIRVSASDGTEPKIVLVNPTTSDAIVSSNIIACKFVITDVHSGVGGVVFRNGATILSDTLHSGDIYQCNISGLVKGEKTILTVQATDSSQKKNTALTSFALTYNPDIEDNVGPVISLIHPAVASFSVSTAETTIQLQCTDQSRIKSIAAKKGNVALTVEKADSSYVIAVTGLAAGKIDTVVVTATDSSSNQNVSTFPISIKYEPSLRDRKGPSIRLITPPVNNDTVDQPSVVMKVICIDESKIASVRFKFGAVSGVMNKQNDTTFAMIVSGLVTGNNQITISATDSSLNSNVSDSVFTVSYDRTHNDSVKPAINCKQAVRDTLIVSALPAKLDVTCTDASGIKSVACKKGTGALTVTPGSGNVYSVDLKTLTTGVVDTFNFTVTDNATKSNTATKSIFVIYDLVHKFDTTYYNKNFTIS